MNCWLAPSRSPLPAATTIAQVEVGIAPEGTSGENRHRRAARVDIRMVDIDLIRGTELFAELDDAALQEVAQSAVSRELRRGDVLFIEGTAPQHLYVVEDGRIAIASKSIDGRESVFALMERGELFGEMGLLDGEGRSAERSEEHTSELQSLMRTSYAV